ncbi:MAG: 16S rRNA (adenine(1518)-N(6)/adenine(1519)-N(6))-dimethyltransferase [Candidatus Doudnabacteria bacterium]|nr:16S rRNA (adenine(1518)-N(6)/adenine(1519)-N(6))-dimethyltransferase [Candidatus Doudnabacteria bacterium]
MDSEIRKLKSHLREAGISPNKTLGQNFLIDESVLAEIVGTANLHENDCVLEIGAGLGVLTRELARHAARVVAFESDRQLLPALVESCRAWKNLSIVGEDFLKSDFLSYLRGATVKTPTGVEGQRSARGPGLVRSDHLARTENIEVHLGKIMDYKCVANIPYNLTGKIFRRLFSAPLRPALVVLLVQKEVAERVAAKPGRMSMLAASVQIFGKPQIVSSVPRTAFFPVPKVDSAILKIDMFSRPLFPESEVLFRLLRIGFAARRKTLANNLAAGLRIDKLQVHRLLAQAGLNQLARAQELSMAQWQKLFLFLQAHKKF